MQNLLEMMQVAFIIVLFGSAFSLDVGSIAKMRLCLHMLFISRMAL